MSIDSVTNIPELLLNRVKISESGTAIHIKRGSRYAALTWRDVLNDVARFASALRSIGVQPGDRVVQASENRYEWLICDLAIQISQAVHVPAHASLTGEQIAYQIDNSDARVVVISNREQAQKFQAVQGSLGSQVRFLAYDPCDLQIQGTLPDQIPTLLASASADEGLQLADRAWRSLGPDSLATILYTSGTTGEPKGVMLSQQNLVTNSLATLRAFAQGSEDVRLCFLPLSHIFARTCDLYTWLAAGCQLALAESRETVLDNCREIRPTLLNGVPYFFDRVRRALLDSGQADVPGAVREKLGGRIRFCCSGGAALPDHVFDFYQTRGVPVLQGYGLTESSPVITISNPDNFRRCAVGRAIPDVDIRIADDGEVLTRGPHVMQGYWKKPDATAEVLRDGWLYTGDLGRLDQDGYLYITGRKKEILVTSGGKNIAPVFLESLLTEDPLILQAMIVGDGRNYLTALIVPNPDALRAAIVAERIPVTSREQALSHPQVLALYDRQICERLKSVSHYEQVRKFSLLDRAFSLELGEVTPKLSLRRKNIEANFANLIASMYSSSEPK